MAIRIGGRGPGHLARVKGGRVFSPPAAFGWPTTLNGVAVPQRFRRFGSRWRMLDVAEPRDLVAASLRAATPIYVNFTSGSDSNTGLTDADPVKSHYKAFAVANALGTPCRVLSTSGVCYYEQSFTNNSLSTPEPLYPISIEPVSGRVEQRAGSSETFPATTNATYTNSYVGGPSSATRVFNLLTDTEMTVGADAAAVDAAGASDAWCNSSATGSAKVHIHRADGLRPTSSNTLVVRNINAASMDAFASDIYIRGFDFVGGALGGLFLDGAGGAKNVVLEDVTARYSGTSVNMLDGIRIRRVAGLVALFDVVSDKHVWKDNLNFHDDGTLGMYVLVVNGIGRNAGKSPSTSNNALTPHDSVVMAAIGGEYTSSLDGSVVHAIESTKTWLVGATVAASAAGGAGNAAVKASNSAKMWLEDCTIYAPAGQYALHAQGGTIYLRNCTVVGDVLADVGGTITTF